MKTDLKSLNGFMWTRRPSGCEPDSSGHATHFTFKHKKKKHGTRFILVKNCPEGWANWNR